MGALDVFYKTIVRRNSVYVGFILVGAFFGEQAVDKVGNSLWESNNKGKLFKDIVASQQEADA
ncbi:hypothetical protein APUTEX25_001168 [Auxenochlorella protothecoides]|uniref:Complex III subunit 9 n=1 Tax=Auxenochlorella protothecoides TaxID=3075 RepID=Q9XFY0_AUXPR|nr:hypothetical protein APUTEX25_001168 [Auxenochlorella protothecoides]CAB42583.1 putative ubiquinone-cytochrome c reductase [Auxenochlorella protothecoides]|eukprot:RMZ53049.1 hypothetical protein APUTEX25_001168 [Auxenochlorella protothecoides]